MAELIAGAFLSSVFQVTIQRLASRDFRGCFRKGLVEELEITLNSINQLLDDAETKQYQNTYVKNWLHKLKHEVYEVEQLLDIIATNAQRKGKTQHFLSGFTNRFESRIKDLLDTLKLLAHQKDVLGLNQRACTSEGAVRLKSSKRLPTASLVDESCIYGRDDDKNKIINYLLLDNDGGNHVSVISIVGLGGMGKTTLARLVYNDHKIEKQFELKAWVHVSESFDVVGLTKTILRSFHSSSDGEDLDPLKCQLQQILTGKKFLLVLDDIWNGNEEFWEQLLLPFNHGSSGSKIIVTTRDKHVALVMKSEQQLHLKQLEEKDCWSLFVKHAFQGKNVFEYPNLESIGKKIVEKCGGLPLAVKTLGNLLQRKFSQGEWSNILETDMWHLSKGDDEINPVLRLSYHNLPSNLKRCFAYCSIFPKGYEFEKDELIKLWMAEGLLKCCKRDKSEEELGNEFFDDLESISFFQQSINPLYSRTILVMHDLVNDLAKSESREFCLQIEGDRLQDISERTRHIWCGSLDLKDGARILRHIYKIKGLRGLLVEAQGYYDECLKISNNVQHEIFSKLKYLRMLSFCDCDLTELSDEICNLKLLRYLDLTRTEIKRLPDSICKLYNLQTLILEECSELTKLPSYFYKLANLRHLNLKGTDIKKMPKQIRKLNDLQTLTDFVVGVQSGSDIKELDNLNHLRGKLCISGLENVIDPADAAEVNLKDKKHLEELSMEYSIIFNYIGREVDVLDALQPNSNLKRLTITYYNGSSFPNWLMGFLLPNLVSLKLHQCRLCSMLPPLGQLPYLKELSISYCYGIEIIGKEFYGNSSTIIPFRSLEVLEFAWMNNWEEWFCIEGFPLLKKLSIRYCHRLKRALPRHLPSLQKLEISDCKKLEASIPKADNIEELYLDECDSILVNELPSSLKTFVLRRNWYTEFSLEEILFNNIFLEMLVLDVSRFIECPSLDLRCYSLRTLSLSGWHSSSLPFTPHLFTNLHYLELSDCPQLESFPRGGLPSNLSKLVIQNCPKLIGSREDWGLFQLNSLKSFRVVDDFKNVESFPEESLLPPTLHTLCLYNCSKLRIMNYKGLLHLKSLQSLNILSCPCLESLPEEGLPISLSTLAINRCSLLKEKYQKKEGERWHTIRHIPSIKIDYIEQQG
ncbi:putative P-loop containing nucleoside triphosphate hydrolase, leucine-rich repeat domain, L [Medicago truncatula]|uniref:NBS-LRR type disease resistance protein n=1 Tax=Medicago truncatula TaxID=3880 RepID=G7IWG5_MEDTR|nr:putative disease resistance protein At3g14460 [Medicago truncatula]AES69324.1 NBS-LRR type disease resistance protein [Medicago truncatula]RHN66150.1 putative P-loop containing nucleoside triphosphate hydrolase, leucine-rich repeat domain, L [Medicago truncatula]